MKSNLIKIGNSKGVRITSSIIRECELGNEVEINPEEFYSIKGSFSLTINTNYNFQGC